MVLDIITMLLSLLRERTHKAVAQIADFLS